MLEGEILYLNKCDCHYNHNCLQEIGGEERRREEKEGREGGKKGRTGVGKERETRGREVTILPISLHYQ